MYPLCFTYVPGSLYHCHIYFLSVESFIQQGALHISCIARCHFEKCTVRLVVWQLFFTTPCRNYFDVLSQRRREFMRTLLLFKQIRNRFSKNHAQIRIKILSDLSACPWLLRLQIWCLWKCLIFYGFGTVLKNGFGTVLKKIMMILFMGYLIKCWILLQNYNCSCVTKLSTLVIVNFSVTATCTLYHFGLKTENFHGHDCRN